MARRVSDIGEQDLVATGLVAEGDARLRLVCVEIQVAQVSGAEEVVVGPPDADNPIEVLDGPTGKSEAVAALAVEFGKTTRSIVAKLSREGVYKKAEYVGKTGAKPETKESKVERIAKLIGTTADKMGGLEAATKGALDLLVAALTVATTDELEGETPEDNAEMA